MVNTNFQIQFPFIKLSKWIRNFKLYILTGLNQKSFRISPTGLNTSYLTFKDKLIIIGNRNNTEVHYGLLENNTFLIKK